MIRLYDVESRAWRRIQASGDIPSHSCSAAGVAFENLLYIFGGANEKGPNDQRNLYFGCRDGEPIQIVLLCLIKNNKFLFSLSRSLVRDMSINPTLEKMAIFTRNSSREKGDRICRTNSAFFYCYLVRKKLTVADCIFSRIVSRMQYCDTVKAQYSQKYLLS